MVEPAQDPYYWARDAGLYIEQARATSLRSHCCIQV